VYPPTQTFERLPAGGRSEVSAPEYLFDRGRFFPFSVTLARSIFQARPLAAGMVNSSEFVVRGVLPEVRILSKKVHANDEPISLRWHLARRLS
jgi:hypothetical protein